MLCPSRELTPLMSGRTIRSASGSRPYVPSSKRSGKPSGILARIQAIADEDSDGDGIPNLLELVTGHFPGEPEDQPATAELSTGRTAISALKQAASGYAWNPFERVVRPELPLVRSRAWTKNAIDFFIAAEHESRGLTPRPQASLPVLLRRLYLDLTGLPPEPDELHAFLADDSADAYEKVVDRLLASPRYGERWGRHWMDVWRYSDWAGWGQQVRDSQPHIWHWRDWIVESLNSDMPYDRMIIAMLAADEADPDDLNALRATGYLARNFKLLSREKWMQDVVDHTSQAFLGVTLGCARCHDHMYDPILQKDYYQVRAVFEPHQVRIDRVPGTLDTAKDGLPRAYDGQLDAKTHLFVRGDDRNPTGDPLTPGVPEALNVAFPKVVPVVLPRGAIAPDRRPFVIRDQLAASQANVAKAQRVVDEFERRSKIQGRETIELELARFDLALAKAELTARDAVERAEALVEQGRKGSAEWTTAAEAATRAQRSAILAAARRAECIGARRGARSRQESGPRLIKRTPNRFAPWRQPSKEWPSAKYVLHANRGDDLSRDKHRPAPRPGSMDHGPSQSVDGPGGRESSMGSSLRPGDCSLHQRFRPQWAAAVTSGFARLAGGRACVTRLEYEVDPPPDRHQCHLPPGFQARASRPRPRPGQPLSVAVDPSARRGRGCS